MSNFCDPMDCSTPGFPVPHHLPEIAQVYVHCISNDIQPFHPLPPSSSAFKLPQYQLENFLALSFPISWLFTTDGQSIGASASASVPPMSIQGWFPLRLTGFISLLSKGLSRVFSSISIKKYQFFWCSAFFMWNKELNALFFLFLKLQEEMYLNIWGQPCKFLIDIHSKITKHKVLHCYTTSALKLISCSGVKCLNPQILTLPCLTDTLSSFVTSQLINS